MQHAETAAYLPAAIIATTLEERYQHCAWCWQKQRPGEPYPRAWSSTICPECQADVEAEADRIKAERATRKARAARLALIAARLSGYAEKLSRKQRRLANIAVIYQDDPEIFPLQVVAAQHHMSALRQLVNEAKAYLGSLESVETQWLKPWPVIMRLGSTDYHLTELLLTIAMFGPICQSLAPERVRIHMDIRAMFTPLLAAYDDTASQLNALAQKARQMEKGA